MELNFIDFHTHAFPDKIAQKTISFLSQKGGIPPYSDGSIGGLRQVLTKAGISAGVVLPVVTKPGQFASITGFAKEINEKYQNPEEGTVMVSFGGIHPDCDDYRAELRAIVDAGLIGVKLHPDYQGVFFDDVRFLRIMEYASELGLIILTHAGLDVGIPDPIRCTPDRVKNVMRQVHPKKLVLAHMGGNALFEDVLEQIAGEDVYFDTAYCLNKMEPDFFVKLCRAHGTDKVLFATDCPWGEPEDFVKVLQKMPFTDEELQFIAHRNAEQLLGLSLT